MLVKSTLLQNTKPKIHHLTDYIHLLNFQKFSCHLSSRILLPLYELYEFDTSYPKTYYSYKIQYQRYQNHTTFSSLSHRYLFGNINWQKKAI